jgi:hypothetical protein
MKKIITTFILLFMGITSNAQGIHGGFSSGTQLLKIEAGYSLDENLHLGAYYSIGMDLSIIPLPSSYGAYGRYTFNKKEIVNNITFRWLDYSRTFMEETIMKIKIIIFFYFICPIVL